MRAWSFVKLYFNFLLFILMAIFTSFNKLYIISIFKIFTLMFEQVLGTLGQILDPSFVAISQTSRDVCQGRVFVSEISLQRSSSHQLNSTSCAIYQQSSFNQYKYLHYLSIYQLFFSNIYNNKAHLTILCKYLHLFIYQFITIFSNTYNVNILTL